MNRTVLFVDDDEKLLRGIARRFEEGFDIRLASSGQEGLEILRRPEEVAVVVSDMRMPIMNGLEFIHEARKITKHTVYMMLTGNQDLQTAVEAVNQGEVFRFFRKPCPSQVLVTAVESGLQQYDLTTSRDELLHRTFCGSVKLLTEVLELSHPKLFRRSHAVQNLMKQILDAIHLTSYWQYKIAAQLVFLGSIVVNDAAADTEDQEISDEMSRCAAAATSRLITHIPRLETVAEIIKLHPMSTGELPCPGDAAETIATTGATLLRSVLELDARIRRGVSHTGAVREIVAIMPHLPSDVINALSNVDVRASELAVDLDAVEVTPDLLEEGMVLAQHAQQTNGMVLIAAGTRITGAIIEKIRHAAKQVGLDPLRVYA